MGGIYNWADYELPQFDQIIDSDRCCHCLDEIEECNDCFVFHHDSSKTHKC